MNPVDQGLELDQMASDEASWSESTVFPQHNETVV